MRDPEKRRRTSEYNKKYYAEHKEYYKEKNKDWTENNRERRNELHKKYRTANKDKVNSSTLNAMYRRLYGISKDDFDQICRDQKHLCKICNLKKKLVCDHNHTTGKVRAALCHNCNIMIAHAKENPAILEAGIKYIEEYNA